MATRSYGLPPALAGQLKDDDKRRALENPCRRSILRTLVATGDRVSSAQLVSASRLKSVSHVIYHVRQLSKCGLASDPDVKRLAVGEAGALIFSATIDGDDLVMEILRVTEKSDDLDSRTP